MYDGNKGVPAKLSAAGNQRKHLAIRRNDGVAKLMAKVKIS